VPSPGRGATTGRGSVDQLFRMVGGDDPLDNVVPVVSGNNPLNLGTVQ
jgi:hypothetical protein